MKKNSFLILSGVLLVSLLTLTACLPKPTPRPTGESPAATESTGGEVQETEPPVGEGQEEAPPAVPGVPEDVPIPEGAYKLQVARAGESVNFQVDGEIDGIVDFYNLALPNLGWETTTSPDTKVAAFANLLRENANGDRLSINLQYNELGGFVVVMISISRVQ